MPTYVLTDSLYVAISQGSQIQHIQNKCIILQPAQAFSASNVYHLHPPSCQVNDFHASLPLPLAGHPLHSTI